MRVLKLFLLPIAALVEMLALALCWIVALFSPSQAGRLSRWATGSLPDLSWYLPGRDTDQNRYKRLPEHDRRIGRGDNFAGDAWLDRQTGAIVYGAVGCDRNAAGSLQAGQVR